MSVYSLAPDTETHIRAALTYGGRYCLTLLKPKCELRATIHIEKAGTTAEATITMGNTLNSMTLQTGDTANAQHLADFIEAIANGTAGTAAESAPQYHQAVIENFSAFNAASPAALTTDMVNHPPHYTGHPSGVECIEVAEHLPFCLGNAFKYLFRRNGKATLRQDLEKALWYINRERDYRLGSIAIYMISEEAAGPLQSICDHEPAPYCYIMEMVGSGRMLDLAADMLQDQIEALITH